MKAGDYLLPNKLSHEPLAEVSNRFQLRPPFACKGDPAGMDEPGFGAWTHTRPSRTVHAF